jgi:NAD(P)-dependent dehydrogenase (short-subunit alcohol dehydrogenase family)
VCNLAEHPFGFKHPAGCHLAHACHDPGVSGARAAFGPESTTDDVLADLDLSGTIALVTGASAGLGAETVRALAARHATVIAAVRDVAKAERTLADPRSATVGRIVIEQVDLSSLTSVRAFADRVLAEHPRLHLLVANAGIMACPEQRTADGFELQFATNHLGHFLLVNRLAPLLASSAPSRVVALTSVAHRSGELDLADLDFTSTRYEPWTAYARSKTANVLFAVELDRRLRPAGVRACAVHPGGVDTELFRHLDADALAFVAAGRRAVGQTERKSVQQGAATVVWAGVVAGADEIGGRYVEDCRVAPVIDGDAASLAGVRSFALDPTLAAALWTRSEQLVGERSSIG